MADLEKIKNKKEYLKKYRLKNKEKQKEYIKIYREKNKVKIKEKVKEYDKNNKQKKKKYDKEYKENNKEKIKKYQKNRRETDPIFKLNGNIRSLVYMSLKKQGYTKKSMTYQILGCTYEEFKLHLERQFKVGMSWGNQGLWHLDHIYPVSLAKDEQELIRLNHYTNFQPMWAIENIIKGNKIIPNTQIKLI